MRVAMISIYPPPNSKHSKLGGVASYTHNLVNSFPKNGVETIVFSDKLPSIELNYAENGIIIKRCWNKGILYPFQIFFNIFSSKIDIIHIQHEFFLYGNGVSAAFFPLLQFLLRLLNKPIIVTIHGVIPLSKLDGGFVEENKLRGNPAILKTGLYILVKLIVKLSDCTIVHEDKLKGILQDEYKCNSSKIFVIPHGIEDRKDSIENWKAKQLLGYQDKKIVLFFGYLTGYKGIELLIDAFNDLDDKNALLIIAGGEHPRLKDEESYKNYIAALKKRATDTGKNIVFTGFIPEEKIAIYFSAADIVVCPYTVFMASSGPLSLSLAYERPFLLSEELRGFINDDTFIFEKNPKSLSEGIKQVLGNSYIISKSLMYINELKNLKSWRKIGEKYFELYNRM